jgi:beta-glucosidase
VIGETAIEAIRYRDPSLPFGVRADDLLARLTSEEKVAMLHQHSPAIPRLGLAEFRTGMEGVHGASWRDHGGSGKVLPATVFPQPVGLAAAWDPELAWEVGRATGLENRALHDERPLIGLNVWAPVVNLLRDPRWGRNEEGYSEDPLLSALLGTAFGAGLSGQGFAAGPGTALGEGGGYLLTAPTIKHFLGYNNEDFRDLTSSALRARVLHEYDLVPFKAAIEARAVTGVMPSYNLVNGRPAHVSPLLALTREWTDEELLHCSDAWAPSNLVSTEHYFDDHPQAFAAALRAGLDSFTDHDGDSGFVTGHIATALQRQLISMAEVDLAVRRKLLIRLRLGEFDPGGGPFASGGVMLTGEHRALALRAARRSAVLLRNDAGLLPLSGEAPLSIAVVGPLAATVYEDWYSPALPYSVSVSDGLAETFGKVVTHEAAGRVRTSLGVFDVFDWGAGIVTLRSSDTGKYLTATRDGLAVSADKPDGWFVHETFKLTLMPGGAALLESTATQQSFRLAWEPLADGTAEAVAAAGEADAAVVVVGNDPMIGGREGHDRHTLELPAGMARLVREVTEANPRTVLVVMSSYPYLAPDEARAVVWTSHAGQETGRAIASLLAGEHDVPVRDGAGPVSVRARAYLHDVRLRRAHRRAGRRRAHRDARRHQRRRPGRVGGCPAVRVVPRAGPAPATADRLHPGRTRPGRDREGDDPRAGCAARAVGRRSRADGAAWRAARNLGRGIERRHPADRGAAAARCRRHAKARPGRRRRLRRSSERDAHRHHPFLRRRGHRRGLVTGRLGALPPD